VYVDTAVLLKLLVRESDSGHYVRLIDGQKAWSSELTFTEVFSALLRKERERAISPAHRRRAYARVDADVASRRLSLLPVTREVLTTANVILEACSPQPARGAAIARRRAPRLGAGDRLVAALHERRPDARGRCALGAAAVRLACVSLSRRRGAPGQCAAPIRRGFGDDATRRR
jgi:predicted nucleic acid-binding protein